MSISEMVDRLMPLVAKFKFLIQRIYFPTIDRIGLISAPILFIRGLQDEIVPNYHTQKLYDKATKSKFKEMYNCETGDHNATW